MTEIFNNSGHLNIDALEALCDGGDFSELERLEIAEHLSFCDCCVTSYMEALEAALELSPETPLAPGIISRLRKRLTSQLFRRYAAVTAAASFAILFWNIGVFDAAVQLDGNQLINMMSSRASSFSETSDKVVSGLSEAVNKFVSSFEFERGLDHGEK